MLDAVANFINVTVSTGYDQNATSIVLASGGSTLPSAPFNLVWWNVTDYPDPSKDPNREIVRVTNVSSNTLTVTRGQEGIAASTKNTAGKTYIMINAITAKMIADIQANLRYPWQTPGAVVGTIDGVNTVFTLPWTPQDAKSVVLFLNQQPYYYGIHFTISGNQATYLTAPNIAFANSGHFATGQ